MDADWLLDVADEPAHVFVPGALQLNVPSVSAPARRAN